MSNTLQAIYRVAKRRNQKLLKVYKSNTRANAMGDALEEYVKDAYAGSDPEMKKQDAAKLHSKCFSYIGNQNNPPDFILKGSDAIEVKKIEGYKGALALNSSYPKSKLHVDDCRISNACRECEAWDEKDIIYVVGSVPKGELKVIYFVYGDCYAASRETYENIQNTVRSALSADGIETENTNELAKVFDYLYELDKEKEFQLVCIMRKEKYTSFPAADRHKIESEAGFSVSDAQIKSPDNPAKQAPIKLITFSK